MAFELPEGIQQPTVQTGVDTAGIAGIATSNLPIQAQPAQDENIGMLGKIGLALEAFGSGYRGQEPMLLKLRRQQMLEDQQRQEREIKLTQMKQQQTEQENAMFFKGVDALKDNPKAFGQLVTESAMKGVPAAQLFKKAGVTTKDASLLTSPDFLSELSIASPATHAKVVEALKGGGMEGVDANEAQYWVGNIKTRLDKKREVRAEAEELATLKKREDSPEWDKEGADAERLTELRTKAMKRRNDYTKARVEEAALGATGGARDLAAGVKTPDAITAEGKAELAGKGARTLNARMGDDEVTLQETEPGSGQWELLTVGGRPAKGVKKPMVSIDMGIKASEEAAKKYVDKASETYQQLKSAPSLLKNMAKAKELIPEARGFMGTGGETLLGVSKFLNNRLGFRLDTKGIKNVEELRSRVFQNVMENLKKLDAQPSQLQQTIMMDALGGIGTDPNALPAMLDAYADIIREKVEGYNAEVTSAEKRGTKFPYDPVIKLPPRDYTPKLDFEPPKTWGTMDDKQKYNWVKSSKRLTDDEAYRYIAGH